MHCDLLPRESGHDPDQSTNRYYFKMNIDATTTIESAKNEWANLCYHANLREFSFCSENEELSIKDVSPSNVILMFRNEICCCPEMAIQNQDGLTDYDTDRLKEIYNTLKELFEND